MLKKMKWLLDTLWSSYVPEKCFILGVCCHSLQNLLYLQLEYPSAPRRPRQTSRYRCCNYRVTSVIIVTASLPTAIWKMCFLLPQCNNRDVNPKETYLKPTYPHLFQGWEVNRWKFFLSPYLSIRLKVLVPVLPVKQEYDWCESGQTWFCFG